MSVEWVNCPNETTLIATQLRVKKSWRKGKVKKNVKIVNQTCWIRFYLKRLVELLWRLMYMYQHAKTRKSQILDLSLRTAIPHLKCSLHLFWTLMTLVQVFNIMHSRHRISINNSNHNQCSKARKTWCYEILVYLTAFLKGIAL